MEYVPAWQRTHLALVVTPEPVEYFPESQLWHPRSVYMLVPVLYEPALHKEHCASLV